MDAWTIKRLTIAIPLLGIGAYLLGTMAMVEGRSLIPFYSLLFFRLIPYFLLGGGALIIYQIIHKKRHGEGLKLSFIDKIGKMQEEIKQEEKNQSFLQKRKWEFIIYGGVFGFIALIFATDFNEGLIMIGIYGFVGMALIAGVGFVAYVSLGIAKRVTKRSQ